MKNRKALRKQLKQVQKWSFQAKERKGSSLIFFCPMFRIQIRDYGYFSSEGTCLSPGLDGRFCMDFSGTG